MNDRNTDLFFNEDNEEVALITLNDEEGNEVDAALMAVFQIEEVYSDEEFAVLMPLEQDEEALMNGQGEVLIFRYFEDEAGDPILSLLKMMRWLRQPLTFSRRG